MRQLQVNDISNFSHQFDQIMQPFIAFIHQDHVLVETVQEFKQQLKHAAKGDINALTSINSWDRFDRILVLIDEDYSDALRLDDESPELYGATAQLSFNLHELRESLNRFRRQFV